MKGNKEHDTAILKISTLTGLSSNRRRASMSAKGRAEEDRQSLRNRRVRCDLTSILTIIGEYARHGPSGYVVYEILYMFG